MADREREQHSQPFDRQRAVSLLEQATQFLREYSGNSAVCTQSENSEVLPAGSRQNEQHNSQRLQAANHTTTTSSVFTDQSRPRNEDNILGVSLPRESAASGRVLDNFRSFRFGINVICKDHLNYLLLKITHVVFRHVTDQMHFL